jgi:hypothetical protein
MLKLFVANGGNIVHFLEEGIQRGFGKPEILMLKRWRLSQPGPD